jgi:hypothetical protein
MATALSLSEASRAVKNFRTWWAKIGTLCDGLSERMEL